MDLQHIAAGKNAFNRGLAIFIYHSAVGHGIDGNAGATGQLIFGDQAHGQQQRIAFDIPLCAGNHLPTLVHLADSDTGKTLFTVNLGDGGA